MRNIGSVACALLLVLALACRRDRPVPKREPTAPTASIPTSADASSALPDPIGMSVVSGVDASIDAGAPGSSNAYARLAPIAMGGDGYAGFSSDDRYLGYEISTCETCADEFHFFGPGVPPLSFKYFDDPTVDESAREKR